MNIATISLASQVQINVKTTNPKWIPQYQSAGAAGADLLAAIETEQIIPPNCSALIPTGIFLEIPHGYEVQIRPRSGLAFQHQLTVLNAPGTIDSDYRGEIQVLLINHGKSAVPITPEMRIAQMIIAPVIQARFQEVTDLNRTERHANGFGSTGR